MAITDWDTYRAMVEAPRETLRVARTVPTAASVTLVSLWAMSPGGGAAPTTAAACASSTPGALGQADGTLLRVVSAQVSAAHDAWSALPGALLVVDRLSHQGGLSGGTASVQTANLPTAALTRYTGGAGVWIVAEVYAALGATGVTVTASYTNQDGVGGRTTTATSWAGAVRFPGCARILPLQAGDTGVRSVQSVTLSATSGVVGAWGVSLVRPLAVVPIVPGTDRVAHHLDGLGGGLPEVLPGACLAALATPFGVEASDVVIAASLGLAEDR